MSRYQPKLEWQQTKLDEHHVPTDLDWIGYDGQQYIGRIRKETNGPTKGKWQWAGSYPRPLYGSPPLPNVGYCGTAREAVQKVEEYWLKSLEIRDTGRLAKGG